MKLNAVNRRSSVTQPHDDSAIRAARYDELRRHRAVNNGERVVPGSAEWLSDTAKKVAVIVPNLGRLPMHLFFCVGHRGAKRLRNRLVAKAYPEEGFSGAFCSPNNVD